MREEKGAFHTMGCAQKKHGLQIPLIFVDKSRKTKKNGISFERSTG
jgi:hypothetical protein